MDLHRIHWTAFEGECEVVPPSDSNCRGQFNEQVFQSRSFHSDDGIGFGETAFLRRKCLPAPGKVLGCSAGLIRTYGLPNRVTNISSPSAARSKSAESRSSERRVTVFMSAIM